MADGSVPEPWESLSLKELQVAIDEEYYEDLFKQAKYRREPPISKEEAEHLRYFANAIRGMLRLDPIFQENTARLNADQLRRLERRRIRGEL